MNIGKTMRVAAILLCAALAASPGLAQDRIEIGVSLALTGNAATYGSDIKNVLQFANFKLTDNRYQLVFEDDRCDGRTAVTVARRFIDVLKLKYVAGFACSSTVISTAKLYEQAKTLVMIVSASAAEISGLGDYIFRTWSSDSGAAKTLYGYVRSHHKKIGILSEQTEFAQGFLRSFSENNADGALVIVNENFLTDTTDLRSILLKLKSAGIDGLYINSQTELTTLAALKQVRELKLNLPLYNAYWAGTAVFLEKAGTSADEVIYVDLPTMQEAATPEGLALYEEYKATFGPLQSTELFFATGFEGFRALHQAIESGKDPRAYLYETKFNGIIGPWSFDKNGDIQGLDFVLKVIRNGKPVPLQ